MDLISYILSRKYVDNSISGISGVLAGKNCTIYSSTKSGDTTTIVFKWTADDGTEKTTEIQVKDGETPTITSTEIEGGHTITFATTDPSQSVSFNVMDGAEGQRGVSVIRADVDNNNYLKLELSDGNIINAGQIKTVSMVDNTLSLESANPVENRVITSALNNKVNKVSGKQLSTEDFTTAEKNKLANIENGAQVNTLENLIINGEEATIVDKKIALNIITSAVSNLQNYYLKTETYTKQEVEELIGSTVGVTIEIVQELPTVGQTNVIYFLPTETANVYSQYIYTATDGWVLIGSTSVDLSNYYTKGQVDTLLNGKQNVLTIDAFPTAMSNNPVASGGVYSAIAQMQPQFQFTNMPVASESNYGFVYQYIGNAGTYEPNMFYRCVYNTYAGEYRWEEVIFHATVTVDSELSSTSTNPVQNKVVKEALDAKQDIMQFSTMPSAQDNLGKIVQYTGATTATYQNACFYKAVYDSEHDVYVWTIVKFSADISVDNVLSDVSENPVQNKVITNKFDEYKTAFTGTEEEWNSLTSEEQNVYDIMNITNDGDVLNLGIYLEKKTAMPVASEDVENRIYLYTGTTTQNYKKGVVYQCVSDGQDPATYSWVALIDFGTAALKNSTDRVSPNNTDLVESQSVYSAINTALSSIYTPRGDITCAELTSSLLISDNIGNVYETSDSGTTTALFLQGAGHPIAVGSNVGIINAGEGRILFNLMANAFDLTSYQKKDLTQAIEGATTVEGALGALNTKEKDDIKDIYEVMGKNGAKNLNSYPYQDTTRTTNGITFTDLGDGTIQANGTATADAYFSCHSRAQGEKNDLIIPNGRYILSGCPSGGGTSTYNMMAQRTYNGSVNLLGRDSGDGVLFVANGDDFSANEVNIQINIFIKNGQTVSNLIFKPMLRLAFDTDNTYVPYVPTNRELVSWKANNKLGAKNILRYPYSDTTKTVNGITFTDNGDGTVTADGTATDLAQFIIVPRNSTGNFTLANGAYILNGCPAGGSNSSYRLHWSNSVDSNVGSDYGDGCTVNVTDSQAYYGFFISIANGTTVSNLVFKPMLRLAEDTDNTYQPYAMTNRELTDIIPSNASASNKLVAESDVGYFYQTSDVEGEYDANDFAVVGKTIRYCVKSPVHGYQVDGTTWWGFYETVCFRGGGYGYQTFRTMLGMPVMAIRQLYNTSWGDWEKLVTESDITPSGTQKTIHRNYTNIGPEVLFDEFGILTKTPTELINALKNKGYIIGITRYTQLHCVINFVNSNANYVIVSDGTHSIDLKNGWIEFEGAFVSGTSTFGSEERWVMKLYNVLTCEMAIVTKRAGTSATPIMKSVTLT